MKSRIDSYKKKVSRVHPWSRKEFASELGLDGTPKSTWEWRRQGKHRWMLAAWHSCKHLIQQAKFPLTPMNSQRNAALTLAISASELQVVYIACNLSVYTSDLLVWHLNRENFRGSHCDHDDDRSRDAALTIHVNVDEVAHHSMKRNSRIS